MIRPIHLVLLAGLARAAYGQAAPSCAAVSGDRILGRDLAAAVPQLASLPADLAMSYSPAPGVQRFYLVSELQKLATRYGIDAKIDAPVCFAWPVHPLSRQVVIDALQKSLTGRDVDLDITDQCRTQVPAGEVVFPLQGLSAESSHPALWNGYVSYAGNKKFTTWAQVRITVRESQIVATRALRMGELIGPSDIKTVAYTGPLQSVPVIHEDQQATGKCALRPIAAGSVLAESMLGLRQDVEKQQLVTVHIRCGAAHIETQGIAVDAGYRGDVIKVRNPKTGRVFLAQINDHGVVTVVPGGDVGLVVDDRKS